MQIECARSLALLQEHEPGKLGMTPSRDNCEVHARPHNEVKTARKDKKWLRVISLSCEQPGRTRQGWLYFSRLLCAQPLRKYMEGCSDIFWTERQELDEETYLWRGKRRDTG